MQTSKARRVLLDVLLPASILDFRPRLGNRCRKAVAQRQRGPRPILIFVAAKKNGSACSGRSSNYVSRPTLIFVAAAENGPPADRRYATAALIRDFMPKLENRCKKTLENDLSAAVIPDFRPRLGNRCKECLKNTPAAAVILDFRGEFGNRCRENL